MGQNAPYLCIAKRVAGHGVNSNAGRDGVLKDERNTCLAGYRYAIITTSVQTHRITFKHREEYVMEHIKTLNTKNLQNTVKKGGCGECQTSCQSACKTSCTVGNQSCENK